ncbi:hypothetical protein SOMG_00018 [Schizosaccharomyces osmophilus]|uniref:Mug135-like C-terminal domain-containing protein n=1 Tax=Schizosaccharomyces osmophilus TaxID=2545709 RepID=A0AAE9W995_9SCHI|nr:uncharacterized protein SOMG_00018 [Schizosaccharomyces osmophilus]WBW72029.1 hypothetical protein SOMG_00018 [Schizosaccharomyces osmophilus]
MNQDLFSNPFGIAPPSNDSFAALSKFTYEFAEAIPQDRFDSFKSKLASLHKAVTSKLEGGETRPRDDMSEVRRILQELREGQSELREGQSELREGQTNLREEMIQGISRLEGRVDSFANDFRSNNAETFSRMNRNENRINMTRSSSQRSENIINRVAAKNTKPIPFVNGQEPPNDLPELLNISDVDSLNLNQLKTYVKGYDQSFDENEPQASLKRKLADYSGFITPQESLYEFSEGNETLRDVGNINSTPSLRRTSRRH